MTDLFEAGGLPDDEPRPLADRLRPKTLGEVVGQDHLLGPEGPIARMVAQGRPHSSTLWGPPGTGKTVLFAACYSSFARRMRQNGTFAARRRNSSR
jgi:putative ATPase